MLRGRTEGPWATHVDCYPASARLSGGGGGDGEATEHGDTARAQAGGWGTLSGGGQVGTPPDPRRIHPGYRLSPQARAARAASAVRVTAGAAAQADLGCWGVTEQKTHLSATNIITKGEDLLTKP